MVQDDEHIFQMRGNHQIVVCIYYVVSLWRGRDGKCQAQNRLWCHRQLGSSGNVTTHRRGPATTPTTNNQFAVIQSMQSWSKNFFYLNLWLEKNWHCLYITVCPDFLKTVLGLKNKLTRFFSIALRMFAGHEFEFGVCLSRTCHVHTTVWRQDKIMGRFDTLIGVCVLLTLGVCLFIFELWEVDFVEGFLDGCSIASVTTCWVNTGWKLARILSHRRFKSFIRFHGLFNWRPNLKYC